LGEKLIMGNKFNDIKFSTFFMIVLSIVFFVLGFLALQEAQPEHKNKRVYQEIKKYSPYYLEKRIGGFQIRMKNSDTKEKPPITKVFQRLDQLEKGWGKDALKIENDTLIVMDKKGKVIGKIKLKTSKEKKWVKTFFEIK
jgi:hypothetical protein